MAVLTFLGGSALVAARLRYGARARYWTWLVGMAWLLLLLALTLYSLPNSIVLAICLLFMLGTSRAGTFADGSGGRTDYTCDELRITSNGKGIA